ncbi:MAG TPA: protein-L-isoaspartate O-methyltransferase [Candidatus Aquabacterium excrementipullorum]|nr:protein-L-isoaspartate O-methyltransferase [Candidatus Aquabacterium excrementipullorum]
MNVEQARFNMIEQQIRPWDVLDSSILALLSVVRREDFVPPAHQALAFMDLEVPLPAGQAMLNPKVEARIVQDLNLSKRDNVLQIGAGSGYVTALLAHKAQRVIALENKTELVSLARNNLRKAQVSNAEIVEADGAQGFAAQGPYSAIVLTGSVTAVPQALFDQLKPGGRLLAIEGREPVMQAKLYTKNEQGQLTHEELFDTIAPPLDGLATDRPFTF